MSIKNTNIANILDQDSVFSASITVGNSSINVLANSTIVKLANSTVNTAIRVPTTTEYGGNYYLHANGTWQLVAAGATPGGANTQVQFNDSTALGGTAGFTFNKDTNNAVIANTLTVGTATVNSTLAALAALNVTNQTNTATLFVTTSANVGTTFTTNSTVTNAVAVTTAGIRANATGVYPSSNTVGQALGSTTTRWILLANTVESTGLANLSALNVVNQTNTATLLSTGLANLNALNVTNQTNTATLFVTTSANVGTAVLANSIGLTTTGFVNAVTVVNSASHTVGTALVANSIGLTTAGFVNAATVVNSASYTIGTILIANTLGLYHTGIVNAASHTTTGVTANVTGVYPTTNTSGQALGLTAQRWVLFANSIDVSGTWTANGALGTTSQILTANSIGGAYWAAPTGGGNVTKVGTPVDDQVGVWTGDGTIEGTAGFTFSAASNNAVVANTLTVGTATVNSTLGVLAALNVTNQVNTATLLSTGLANLSALNVTNQTNTATLFVTTSANVGTAVLANSIGLTTTGFVNAATVVNSAAHTIASTFIANTLGVTHTGFVNAATVVNSSAHTIGTTMVANTLGVTHTGFVNAATVVNSASHTIGTTFIANTIGVTTTGFVNAATVVNSASHTVGTTFTANATLVNAAAINITGQTNTATLFATTSAAVGANVIANATTILVGNSTSNVLIGNNIVDVGNTTINLVANSTALKLSNSTVNTQITVPTSAAYTATNYFLHANGTWVQVSAGGGGTPGGANTYIQYNDSGAFNGTAGFTYDETTNNVTVANNLNVGANVDLSTTTLAIGNATVNSAANSAFFGVSNSTGSAFVNPSGLTVGNTIVNSIAVVIGNTSVNASTNSVFLSLANSTGAANLTPISLTIGTSIVNSTVISTGAGQFINATAIKAPNTGLITATSAAANGYTYLTGGVLMQWGWVAANTSVGNATFPIAFPTACHGYSAVGNTASTISYAVVIAVNTTVIQCRTGNVTASNCHWMAVGV